MTSGNSTTVASSAPREEWYALPAREVFSRLETREKGLAKKEAEERLSFLGPNKLPETKPKGPVVIFLEQFQSPLIYILLISSVIVFFLGELVDALVILTVLLVNAIVGLIQEGKAENTLRALKNFTKTESRVMRDGEERIIIDENIVVGDVIILSEGEKVPADVRIIHSSTLKINESALTGESEPVSKRATALSKKNLGTADQSNMAFRGTFVLSGHGRAVVVAVGSDTVIGKISRKLGSITSEVPLKADIRSLSRIITVVILVASVALFFAGLTLGNTVEEMFFTSVAVAVSVIPEGLPIVITLVLATGVFRMAKRNALVKRLQAVEALGQADVIAVDKTGTITKNELMIQEVYIDHKLFEVTGQGFEAKGEIKLDGESVEPSNHPEILLAGKVGAFCADARVSYSEEGGTWRVIGDPTEAAMRIFGEKTGFNKDALEQEEPQLYDIPFDTNTKYHTTVHKVKGKNFVTVVGAPEEVFKLTGTIYANGRFKRITKADREKMEIMVRALSSKGLRVLAFAVKKNAPKSVSPDNMPPLSLVGLYGMKDVLREGVREAIAEAKRAGVRVVMITGDHVVTGEALAKEAGIWSKGDSVISGKELEEESVEVLSKRLDTVSVFARVTPEHKLKIIEAFKLRGDTIAMTGDGVNDALSLVAADLGIAMGKIGTEVTQEASDIVLLDDNFKSIVAAIEEGRGIYQTIKKVLLYLFSTGLGELLVIVVALFLLMPLPLLPSQILWLNLVTDGFLVVALAFEPREKLTLRLKKKRSKILVDRLMLERILIMAIVMMGGTLFLFNSVYFYDIQKGWTVALTTLAVFQWFNIWNCRSIDRSIFKTSLFSNMYLIYGTLVVVALQLAAVYTPFMQKVLKTVPLSLSDWVIILVVASSVIVVEELRKLAYRALKKRGEPDSTLSPAPSFLAGRVK